MSNFKIFNCITDHNNILKAYHQTQLGPGKYKREAMEFHKNQTHNLGKLRQSLLDETYKFSGYEEFMVYEPKERLIHAPRYKDKIVQLSINNILKEVIHPKFIFDSYACIDGKGTHRCVSRMQSLMRKAKWHYGEDAYIIKIDIKKFFYTIDRGVLKNIMRKKIDCDKTIELLVKIIDSADSISEKGLPLGNTLSQISANLYLNELDQFCKRKMSLKYYIRYADDIVVIVKNKELAKDILKCIEAFLSERLHLESNKKKTKIFPLSQGVNTVGFKIHPTHKLLRNDSKKKIKRKAKKMRRLIGDGCMTQSKAEQILNSWKGHAQNGNSYNFINQLIARNDYICMSNKGNLKVEVLKC